jgi:hypothetical protein
MRANCCYLFFTKLGSNIGLQTWWYFDSVQEVRRQQKREWRTHENAQLKARKLLSDISHVWNHAVLQLRLLFITCWNNKTAAAKNNAWEGSDLFAIWFAAGLDCFCVLLPNFQRDEHHGHGCEYQPFSQYRLHFNDKMFPFMIQYNLCRAFGQWDME